MDLTFFPSRLNGTMTVPASKSEAHRRMICAGLTHGVTKLTGYTPSEDLSATTRCLQALGARISLTGDELTIEGAETMPVKPLYDCGESGSTLRFFVPIALAMTGGGTFRMHKRLGSRPMDIYRDLFVPRGVLWRMREGVDGAAELHITGHLEAGSYIFPGNVSSQFVSGLLFALPLLEGDSLLRVTPPIESQAYIAMTVKALRDSALCIPDEAEGAWGLPGGQSYRAVSGSLHGDWSQAAVPLCLGALGCSISVTGVSTESIQGDRAILENLEKLGAKIQNTAGVLSASAVDGLHGAELDMRHTPDIAPMLALVCQMAKGESRLTGCGRLRLKECDRLAATVRLLNELGGKAAIENDTIVIEGVSSLKGGVTCDGCGDHRMVMLLSAAAAIAQQPVKVIGVEALGKSWPDYLRVYQSLGGKVE